MQPINSNLQTNFQVAQASLGNKSYNQCKGAIYAEEGEPIYKKDMDLDEDGVVTLEEFNDYCDENNISYAERKQMLQNRLEYQLQRDRAKASENIRKIKSEVDVVYAKEDEENYDEEIDTNEDGKITYQEYIEYCEENEKSKKQEPQELSSQDKKALNTYANIDKQELKAIFKEEI